jgi:hypothetical protein
MRESKWIPLMDPDANQFPGSTLPTAEYPLTLVLAWLAFRPRVALAENPTCDLHDA